MAESTSLNIDISRFVESQSALVMAKIEKKYSTHVMMKMLTEGIHTDITLEACGSSVKAHRCVLASVSRVFRAMFEHEMKEQITSTVEISDMSMKALQLFLVLLYASANNVRLMMPEFENAVVKHSLELFHASHKYDVTDRLEPILVKTLPKALTPDNCWDFFKITYRLPKQVCVAYIHRKFKEVQESEGTRLELERNPEVLWNWTKMVIPWLTD